MALKNGRETLQVIQKKYVKAFIQPTMKVMYLEAGDCALVCKRRKYNNNVNVGSWIWFPTIFRNKKIFLCLIVLLTGCTEKKISDENVPDHVRNMDNVTIYALSGNSKKIQLTRDKRYGDSEDVLFSRMGEFIVDERGRVFIEESAAGRKTIHVFNPNAKHITSIGREGRGPGEFEDICCMKISSGKLYIYDPVLGRISVFSLNGLELVNIYSIRRINLPGLNVDGKFTGTYFIVNSEKGLMSFAPPLELQQSRDSLFNTYFFINEQFQVVSSEVFKQKQIQHHWGYFEDYRIRETFPFFEKPLVAVSQSGRIFTAMSNDFLIQEIDHKGNYILSFYYPSKKVAITREDAIKSSNAMSKNIAENIDLPEYWPVLSSMQFDDKDRLWISTNTEMEDQLKWWVLNTEGELLGTFHFQGDRHGWPLHSAENTKIIQDNYFYSMEKNKETEFREIVRYRIEIEEE